MGKKSIGDWCGERRERSEGTSERRQRRTEQEEEEEVILCVTVIITSVMSLESLGLCHCEADLIGIILPLFNGKVPWNSGITF